MYWNLPKLCKSNESELGLTLTWDVLKCYTEDLKKNLILININMRCIEMTNDSGKWQINVTININMRCIEMCNHGGDRRPLDTININMRCIEIVPPYPTFWTVGRININMRCIEIAFGGSLTSIS